MTTTRLRFATPRDLFVAFPTAEIDVGLEPTDEASEAFVRRLAEGGDTRAALSYCAYLLPRREAVWWAILCAREANVVTAVDFECLAAAEAWVRDPTPARQLRAAELGAGGHRSAPASWAARAAGWAGGNMSTDPDRYLPPAPQATAQAVRGAVLMAFATLGADVREAAGKNWIEAALRYALRENA